MNGSQTILITDGGAHPPDTWAMATADHLVHIDPKAPAARQMAAKKLEMAIAEALIPHHTTVQGAERSALSSVGNAHLLTDIDPSQHLDAAVAAVVSASVGTPWEAHFADRGVQDVIRGTLANHFASSQHIERSWHCDRNPGSPAAQAWMAVHAPGAPPEAADEPPASISAIKPE